MPAKTSTPDVTRMNPSAHRQTRPEGSELLPVIGEECGQTFDPSRAPMLLQSPDRRAGVGDGRVGSNKGNQETGISAPANCVQDRQSVQSDSVRSSNENQTT